MNILNINEMGFYQSIINSFGLNKHEVDKKAFHKIEMKEIEINKFIKMHIHKLRIVKFDYS